jgi:uncharacterized membrane protein
MSRGKMPSRSCAFILASLIFLSSIPSVYAAAEVSLNAMPMAQESDPGTTAEYTIVVNNDGSNDITVTLSASNGAECTGYSSTVEQPQGAIGAGESVDVMLYVNLSNQPSESCDTTVNAVATEGVDPTPGNADVTVTTTAGEGSGENTYGVELSTQHPIEKTWNGNDEEVTWPVVVKNTGQFNESINLDVNSNTEDGGFGCDNNNFQYEIDPNQVSLDSGDEETVTVTVRGMDEAETALNACLIVDAVVTNAAPGTDEENTTDELELELEIPEIKECSFSSSSISVDASPFVSQSARFTVNNDGNTDFPVIVTTAGSKNSWVKDIADLEDGNEHGDLELESTYIFDVFVEPDNSVSAGTIHSITIRINEKVGGSSGGVICSATLEVTVGIFRDGEIEFVGTVPAIDPGSTGSAQMSITNLGNGPGNFNLLITADEPAGWSSTFYGGEYDISDIQVEEGQSITVYLNISVPLNALADEAVVYTVTLWSNWNGETFDEDMTAISVAERHGIDIGVTINTQSGKDGATISYPFTVTNDGNVADNYNLAVSKNSCTSSDGGNTDWDVRFFEDVPNGIEINVINIAAQTTTDLIVKVTIDGGEKSQCRTTIQILNTADQINLQKTFNVTTTSSNLIFRMNAFFDNPGDNPNQMEITQPPGGSVEFVFWIQNDGVFYGNPQEDNAIITIRSIDGVTHELYIDKNGIIYDGTESIPVPMKYVLRDISTGEYATDSEGAILEFLDMDDANTTWLAGGLSETHEIMLFALQVTITLNIDEDVEDGAGGTVYVDVRSEHNAEDVKTLEVVLEIETIHDLRIEIVGEDTQNIEYPDNAYFELRIYNDGNTNEHVVVMISEGLRGWIPLVPDSDDSDFTLAPGDFRLIIIKVEPPESTLSDEFEFTVSVQPKDTSGMIGRKNIELKIIGEEGGGFLPSLSLISIISCITIASVISLYFQRRKTEI